MPMCEPLWIIRGSHLDTKIVEERLALPRVQISLVFSDSFQSFLFCTSLMLSVALVVFYVSQTTATNRIKIIRFVVSPVRSVGRYDQMIFLSSVSRERRKSLLQTQKRKNNCWSVRDANTGRRGEGLRAPPATPPFKKSEIRTYVIRDRVGLIRY